MATGRELFNACCTFVGQPYSTAPGRTDPTSDHKDCSGMVAAGFEAVTGTPLGYYVTVTQYSYAKSQGLVIPYQDALHIVGACFLRPYDPMQGWGDNGHIAMSDGTGYGTVEATPPRVQRLSVNYNAPWSPESILIPGIDYANNGEGNTAPADEDLESNMRLFRNADLPEDDPNNWFLFTDIGWEQNVSHNRVWNLAAYGKVPTGVMGGQDILALAGSIATQRKEFAKVMKEEGVGVEPLPPTPAPPLTPEQTAAIDASIAAGKNLDDKF